MADSNYIKGRRLRLFGGPNGSGKSTIFKLVDKNYDIGYYINADEIEKELALNGYLDLSRFALKIEDPEHFRRRIKNHSLTTKAAKNGFDIKLEGFNDRIFCTLRTTLSYEAALLSDILREDLIRRGSKLTFESVMSHYSKIEDLKTANKNGYKTYLYFISTSSPEINIDRVNLRVKKGGHPVDKDRIRDRYYKSLNLLKPAVTETYRSFIWDNSGREPKLILEVFKGKDVIPKVSRIPAWVNEYLTEKN